MCFHYSLTQQKSLIESALKVKWDNDGWNPVYHAAGFEFLKMPVITMDRPLEIQLFNWGLIPHWIKSKEESIKIRNQTLNARTENVFERPSFRNPIKFSRCLIPADGFFEWMDFKSKKYPHYIFLNEGRLFCFGGICSAWVDSKTGEVIETFSILTTPANLLLEKIHNLKKRMPLIISPNAYETWLNKDIDTKKITSFFTPYDDEEMNSYTISKLITSRSQNSNVEAVTTKFEYPELINL
jgi:putative SOS response-associated peptidase YedK